MFIVFNILHKLYIVHLMTYWNTMDRKLSFFIKDALQAFDDFRNKWQKCMKECFLIGKSMYILKVHSIHYTLR